METDGLGDTNRQLSDYANLEPIPNGRNEVWRAEYDGQAVCLKKFRILDAKQQKVLTFPLSTHQNVSLQNLSQYLVLVTLAGIHEGGAVCAEAAAPLRDQLRRCVRRQRQHVPSEPEETIDEWP